MAYIMMNENIDTKLSIVIPAFNEEKKITNDLETVWKYFTSQLYTYEIIVVDDGSSDKTSHAVQEMIGHIPQLRLIQLPQNRGKGAAVRTGMQTAQGQYAMFADAGTCVPYDNVERGLALLSSGADIAIGSRVGTNSRILKSQPLYRRFGSRVFHFLVRNIIGLPDISDTQCGFKMFRRAVYQDIFSNLVTDGFMFDVETLLYAKWRGYSILPFPVDWSNDPDTRFRPVSGTIQNFQEILRIKYRMFGLKQGMAGPQIR